MAIPVIVILFTLSLSKGAVVVRYTHHERLYCLTFLCNQVLDYKLDEVIHDKVSNNTQYTDNDYDQFTLMPDFLYRLY